MILSELIISCIIAVLLLLLYFYYTKVYKIEKYFRNVPSPPMVPFFGNALEFKSSTDILKNFSKYRNLYGDMVHLKMGLNHLLLTTDYKLTELCTSAQVMKRGFNLKFLEVWMGTGLITADGGPKWKKHRRLITPAFHFKILEQFVDVFESCGDILVGKLAKTSETKSLDVCPYISQCTFDVICETVLGLKLDVQNCETSNYLESAKEMCNIFVVRSFSIWKQYDFLFRFSKDYRVQQDALKVLHGYTNRVIKEKRAQLAKKQQEKKGPRTKERKVFLDLILEATVDGEDLSNEEVREEVDTFMFTGHDTTSLATSFVLYCLANSKEAQDKVLEEQQQLFGDEKNPKVTYSHLQEMKYLENVIKEGLRLYPIAPIFNRLIERDIEYNGMIIPKGTTVLLFVKAIHMDPKYYSNPEEFDPSRFDDIDGRLPYAYIPFGAGPRNCIGQKYAVLEMKSLISKIVRRFELVPAFPRHEMELTFETVLTSLNGVKIGLTLR